MSTSKTFDPSAAATAESGVFGLPFSVDDARVALLDVPFAATTSYGGGAENAPRAIFDASKQVDLFDLDTGRPYEAGIAWAEDEAGKIRALHDEARPLAARVIALGGDVGDDVALIAARDRVNAISAEVNELVYTRTKALLDAGKRVVLIGGDHSTPFGCIRAHAERYEDFGVLHIDAHADLRDAYEGFSDSHASIMFNVANRLPRVRKIVQVGIRDFSEDELNFSRASDERIETHFDSETARAMFEGETWSSICGRIISTLPKNVYVSFDIDGLDPALCPHTGTPVPGGLSFQQAVHLIRTLALSDRTIVGADLNEVSPSPNNDDEWDGNVGARMLYKMIGWMLKSG
jgi:agmatinase